MGPADDGAGSIKEAVTVCQERAGVAGQILRGMFADTRSLFSGEVVESPCQGNCFYPEKGKVSAAAVTSRPAGNMRPEFLCCPQAEVVHPFNQGKVIFQYFHGTLPAVKKALPVGKSDIQFSHYEIGLKGFCCPILASIFRCPFS
jgi:hypothetical protein